MSELKIDWETDGLESITEQLIDRVFLGKQKALLKAAEHAAGNIRETAYDTFKDSKGTLARSFKVTMLAPKDGAIRAGALSDLSYADIQNRGGTVNPKRGENLAIPVSKRAKSTGMWPRDRSDLEFFYNPKTGKKLLVLASGKPGQRDWVQYVLMKSVYITPTYYLDWANAKTEKELPSLFGDALQAEINKVE